MNENRKVCKDWRWPWGGVAVATLFFSLLAYAFYYPLIQNLGTGLDHLGDPALVAWILNWDLHALTTNPLEIFHANIFHPYENTLAFSENFIAPSIMLLPFYAFTKNPVLLYNLAFFLGIVLSGISAYLLAYYLTRSSLLSLIPGIALAFSPFLLAHNGHLQMYYACWIPLLFLCLYRYFDKLNAVQKGRRWWLVAGAVCLLLQFLSNTYYFVFLATTAALFQAYRMVRTEKPARKTAIAETVVFWMLAGLLVLPFAWPYLEVHHALGFDRSIEEVKYFSADVVNYLSYNERNARFGNLTGKWADFQSEKHLTPGIVLTLLALSPVFLRLVKIRKVKPWWLSYKRLPHRFHVVDLLIVIAVAMLAYILTGHDLMVTRNGEVVELIGVKLKMTRPENTVCYILLLITLRCILNWRRYGLPRLGLRSEHAFYAGLTIFAFLMSLGPSIHFADQYLFAGPYKLFYKFVPGYGGLRVPARFGLFVVFGMSILAAMNLKGMLKKLSSGPARIFIACGLPLLLAAEFYSHPPRVGYSPGKRAVDEWLATAPAGNVVELPLPSYPSDFTRDIRAVFHSTAHWKPLFNGYSGYSPPGYHVVSHYTQSFPSELSARILDRLDIDYVVVHNCDQTKRENARKHFELLAVFESTAVFAPRANRSDRDSYRSGCSQELDSSLWQIAEISPVGIGGPAALADGDVDTYWHTRGPQQSGDSIMIEFNKPMAISGLQLYFGRHPIRFPRAFKLQSWSDESGWNDLDFAYDPLQFIDSILTEHPKSHMQICFSNIATERLRLILTSSCRQTCYGIAEINILAPKESRCRPEQ